MTDAVTIFFNAWGMDQDAARKDAISDACAAEVSYIDPRTDDPVVGTDALATYVGMFSTHAPGAVAEVTHLETRGGVTRATVAFKMPNGMAQMGQYFVEHDDAGRITRLIGFKGTGTDA